MVGKRPVLFSTWTPSIPLPTRLWSSDISSLYRSIIDWCEGRSTVYSGNTHPDPQHLLNLHCRFSLEKNSNVKIDLPWATFDMGSTLRLRQYVGKCHRCRLMWQVSFHTGMSRGRSRLAPSSCICYWWMLSLPFRVKKNMLMNSGNSGISRAGVVCNHPCIILGVIACRNTLDGRLLFLGYCDSGSALNMCSRCSWEASKEHGKVVFLLDNRHSTLSLFLLLRAWPVVHVGRTSVYNQAKQRTKAGVFW